MGRYRYRSERPDQRLPAGCWIVILYSLSTSAIAFHILRPTASKLRPTAFQADSDLFWAFLLTGGNRLRLPIPFTKLFIARIYNGFQKTARTCLLRLFLPGAAPFGDFPDLVNAGGVIESLLSYRDYASPIEPKFSRLGGYPQNFGDFRNGQAFHTSIIQKNFEKSQYF